MYPATSQPDIGDDPDMTLKRILIGMLDWAAQIGITVSASLAPSYNDNQARTLKKILEVMNLISESGGGGGYNQSLNTTDSPTFNDLHLDGDLSVDGGITAGTLTGDGAGITNVPGTAPTGTVWDFIGLVAPTGWVLASGLTIGSATSGATERANADTQPLFALIWNSMADSEAPVSGGRGVSAAADFGANKTIQVPDIRGRVIAGIDNMGGTAANRIHDNGGVAMVNGQATGLETTGIETVSNSTSDIDVLSEGGNSNWNVQPTMVLTKIIKL